MTVRLLLALAVALAGLQAAPPPLHSSPRASVLVIGGSMMNGAHFGEATLPAMREHFADCRNIALVLHATHPAERDAMERRLATAFAHLNGAEARSLHQAGDAARAAEMLRRADGIFVGGGETFVLLRELYASGQLELIRERVRAGVPYAGSSAGANVAGLLIGTTNDFPVAEVPSRTALGVFPAVINPHHPPFSAEAEHRARAGKIRIYLSFNPSDRVLALGDAAMARLHDGEVTLEVGSAWLYQADGYRAVLPGERIPELLR